MAWMGRWMDPWIVIASFFLPVACLPCLRAHCLDPSGVVHLGSQDRAFLFSTWIPTGEFFQTVPPSWVRACSVYRVPTPSYRSKQIRAGATYNMQITSVLRATGSLCDVPWNGRRERWGSPLTGSSSRQYGLLIHDTSLSARLIRHRSNPAAA